MSPNKGSTFGSTLVRQDDQEYITVFVPGHDPLSADDSHPQFAKIKAGAEAKDPKVVELFDLSRTANVKFRRLTERVTVRDGRVYFDNDRQDDAVAKQIVKFLEEKKEDWKPLVFFMENIAANPSENSRKQLFEWLKQPGLDITDAGFIIGYKGVFTTSEEGVFQSSNSGIAFVNGEYKSGKIPQRVGDVVEMARSEVADDPSVSCSTGLHVATEKYARGFGSTVVKVIVNPRDVVSVPSDGRGEKVRVCRYAIAEVA